MRREGNVLTRVCPSICLSTGGGVSQPTQPGGGGQSNRGVGGQSSWGGQSSRGVSQWGGVSPARGGGQSMGGRTE